MLQSPVGVKALKNFVEHLAGMKRCIMVWLLIDSSMGEVMLMLVVANNRLNATHYK